MSFQGYWDLQTINFILFCSWLNAKKRRHIAALWVSERNPGGFNLANVCPKSSCLKLWRIKKSLFAMVVNSLEEPPVRGPSEWRPFFPKLTRCHTQPKPKAQVKQSTAAYVDIPLWAKRQQNVRLLKLLQPKKKDSQKQQGENIKNKGFDFAKTSEVINVKRVYLFIYFFFWWNTKLLLFCNSTHASKSRCIIL